MTKKMTAKQSGAPVMSLDDFISRADVQPASKKVPLERPKAVSAPNVPESPARGVGKPPMASEEVRSKTIQIKVTEKELEGLKKQAGGVPVSSYLRNALRDKGIL